MNRNLNFSKDSKNGLSFALRRLEAEIIDNVFYGILLRPKLHPEQPLNNSLRNYVNQPDHDGQSSHYNGKDNDQKVGFSNI